MKHVFWLEAGKIAGRAGPNKDPWCLREIANAGFSSILSVNDGEMCNALDIKNLGMNYLCVPLPANIPPHPSDNQVCIERLPIALNFLRQHYEQGPLLIHCRSGKDRTGLLMAYYMLKVKRMSVNKAMEHVISVRDIAFSSEGWNEMCQAVLTEMESLTFV